MNPVLASTGEFDEYLNEKLHGNASSRGGRTSNTLSRNSAPKLDSLRSQDFLEINTKKYIINETRNANRTNVSHLRSSVKAEKPPDPLEMTHSWKAHLTPSTYNFPRKQEDNDMPMPNPPLAINQRLQPSYPSPSIASRRFEFDDELSPRQPPLPEVPLLRTSLDSPSRMKHGKRIPDMDKLAAGLDSLSISDDDADGSHSSTNRRSHSGNNRSINNYKHKSNSPLRNKQLMTSRIQGNTTKSNDSVDGMPSKVRWVTLSRYLNAWQVEAKLSRGLLTAKSKVLTSSYNNHWVLKFAFFSWHSLYRACRFHEKYTRYQARYAIEKWSERIRHRKASKRKAGLHLLRRKARLCIESLLDNVFYYRQIRKNENKMKRALTFCKDVLLNRMLAQWKLYTRREHRVKEIDEEQSKRRQKIQQFISNIASSNGSNNSNQGGVESGNMSDPHLHGPPPRGDRNNSGYTDDNEAKQSQSQPRRTAGHNGSMKPTTTSRTVSNGSSGISSSSRTLSSNADTKRGSINLTIRLAESKAEPRPRAASANRAVSRRTGLSTTTTTATGPRSNIHSATAASTMKLSSSRQTTAGDSKRPLSATSTRTHAAPSTMGRSISSTVTPRDSPSRTKNSAATTSSRTTSSPRPASSMVVRPGSGNRYSGNGGNGGNGDSGDRHYSDDDFEANESDDGDNDGDGGLTPPPSYNAVVNSEAFRKERNSNNSSSNIGGRNARSSTSSGHWNSNTRPTSTAAATSGRADPSTFEQRAVERRNKLQQLRKQAEDRVAQRQQEESDKARERSRVEAEEAEKIRRNARLKLEQTKAVATRTVESGEQLKRQLNMARSFRRNQILIQYGFAPWRRYIEHTKINELKAINFRNDYLLQSTWSALLGYVVSVRTERMRREHRLTSAAVTHYRRKLMRHTWRLWRMFHKVLKAKAAAVTGHFSRFTLVRRSFHGWQIAYEKRLRETARHMRAVQPRGDRVALRYYWAQWKVFHDSQLFEREIRNRADSKWATVQSWLNKK